VTKIAQKKSSVQHLGVLAILANALQKMAVMKYVTAFVDHKRTHVTILEMMRISALKILSNSHIEDLHFVKANGSHRAEMKMTALCLQHVSVLMA